jgi:hypothetical protein
MRCVGAVCSWAKRGECSALYVPDPERKGVVMRNPNWGERIALLQLKAFAPMCSERLSVKDKAEQTR